MGCSSISDKVCPNIPGNKSIYFLALISFFAQSFVNCMNSNNIGLLILILALFIKEDKSEY